MADFEMRNFLHFPLEKSSYDLKSELLEELDPKVALELMKANKGFRSIYLKDPWRIFGRHVDLIDFLPGRNTMEIRKLCESTPLPCDSLFHLPLLKKIRSCEIYNSCYGRFAFERTRQTIDTESRLLPNLDLIGRTSVRGITSFKEFFSNFKGQINDYLNLDLAVFSRREDEQTFLLFSKIFETQLRNCKAVYLSGWAFQFSDICEVFSKTKIKQIDCRFRATEEFLTNDLELTIRSIRYNGIPSQNREASICIYFSGIAQNYDDDIHDKFLSAFPGMQLMPADKYGGRRYRRKIDDERDCIFELGGYIKASYVASEPQ